MDRQKRSVILPATKEKERVEEVKEMFVPLSSRVEAKSSPKLGTLFSLTPAVSIKVEAKTKPSGPRLLYNP